MEVIADTKVVTVHMKCDECKEGYMVRDDNIVLTTYPAQYSHKCNKCGSKKIFYKIYPYQKYIQTETFREPKMVEKIALE